MFDLSHSHTGRYTSGDPNSGDLYTVYALEKNKTYIQYRVYTLGEKKPIHTVSSLLTGKKQNIHTVSSLRTGKNKTYIKYR